MILARKPPEAAVKELLTAAQLPTADLTPAHMEHFFGAWEGSRLEGVVGVELLGAIALLRSLAVVAAKRGSGLGSELLVQIEHYAMEQGACALFLLTTTAESFFRLRGYAQIGRESAPEPIQRTAEFSNLCPANSVLMVKSLPVQR